MQDVVNEMNKMNRMSLPLWMDPNDELASQAIVCTTNLWAGFLRQTRRKIKSLRAIIITTDLRSGSYEAAPSKSGIPRVVFCGSTENVCDSKLPFCSGD